MPFKFQSAPKIYPHHYEKFCSISLARIYYKNACKMDYNLYRDSIVKNAKIFPEHNARNFPEYSWPFPWNRKKQKNSSLQIEIRL